MNERSLEDRIRYSKLTPILAGLVAFAWMGTARASDADPFAGDGPQVNASSGGAAPAAVPSNSNVAPAPAASPASSAGAIVPGVVEQLPASAYPEPVTRGLYGGPLWLDLQGLQWPYMPQSGVGISGYGWIDGNYRLIRSGNSAISPRYTELLDQGRFLLRITPTYTNGSWFVQAQAEFVANTDQYDPSSSVASVDDVWVRTGNLQMWDVTVGRFQAFDVYPLGMGLDLNTYERQGAYDPIFTNTPNGPGAVPPIYGADYLLYRPTQAKVGNVALHLYDLWRPLRIELLGQFGNDGTENYLGARPAAIIDFGWLKLRGAAEYQYKFAEDPAATAKNTIKNRGVAGSVQVVFAPYVEAGLNAGYAIYDAADAHAQGGEDDGASGNRFSAGGFVDVAPAPAVLPNLLLGAGGNYATLHNLLKDQDGNYERSTNLQVFVAAQYMFYRQLFFKVVGGYAKSHFENQATTSPYDDDMFSVRVRLMYLY
ncbi:MAG TPA: hypothetical protein VLC06_03060 [Polyangia bacterium]|jgi:hypothetical protein|nr:hypothetical protein [Polyangia bacterium]